MNRNGELIISTIHVPASLIGTDRLWALRLNSNEGPKVDVGDEESLMDPGSRAVAH